MLYICIDVAKRYTENQNEWKVSVPGDQQRPDWQSKS